MTIGARPGGKPASIPMAVAAAVTTRKKAAMRSSIRTGSCSTIAPRDARPYSWFDKLTTNGCLPVVLSLSRDETGVTRCLIGLAGGGLGRRGARAGRRRHEAHAHVRPLLLLRLEELLRPEAEHVGHDDGGG